MLDEGRSVIFIHKSKKRSLRLDGGVAAAADGWCGWAASCALCSSVVQKSNESRKLCLHMKKSKERSVLGKCRLPKSME